MYEEYWGLKEKPFENTPDPRFLYRSPQHEEALSRLLYAVREAKGAAMLTGVFGCGKTLLGRTLLKELGKDIYKTAFITNPHLNHIELLMAITTGLGAKSLPTKKTELLANVVLDTLNLILQNNMRDGKKTVVIIDEAHIIEDKDVWEEIRLILNFQLENRFLLTLLLLGQPELKENIDNNKQLAQRIAIKCRLDSLTETDTEQYIIHRLNTAGAGSPESGKIFTESACKLVYEKSGGIPRRINHICDMALLTGFSKQLKTIDTEIIQEVADTLEE